MACSIDHTDEIPAAIGTLPESQAGFWRHRCAGCAYLLGRRHAGEAEARLRERVRRLEAQVREMTVTHEDGA
jgi:hypothetical protein